MKIALFLTIVLSGCAGSGGLYNIEEGDCSLTLADADLDAGILTAGNVNANGKTYVRRGSCNQADLDILKAAERL